MAGENQFMTVADNYRMVVVPLSTTLKPLAALVKAVSSVDLPVGAHVIQMTMVCASEWQFDDGRNTAATKYIDADIEKSIPAADAFDWLRVKASSGTPNLIVELFFAK